MKNRTFLFALSLAFVLNLCNQIQLLANNFNPIETVERTQDSIIIKFGEGSRIVVYVANGQDKAKLKEIDVNALLKKIEQKLERIGRDASEITIEDGDFRFKIYQQADGSSSTTVVTDTTKKMSKWEKWEKIWDWDEAEREKKRNKRTFRSYFDLDLGLNTYTGNVGSNSLYELSPISSRYVALGFGLRTRLSQEKNIRLNAGLEVAWNNFMFENNNIRVYKNDDETSFEVSPVSQEKSKLVTCYLNAPVTISYRSSIGLGFAIGGYVGYRLDSYNAFVESGRSKTQAHSSYHLNSLRHGIRVAADFKYLTLFCNYDTSNLFQTGKAPELQVISFGVKLIAGSL
jgi:hypothetical protein